MTKRERNILGLAIAVGVVFILTKGMPIIQESYGERATKIERLQTNLERERRLIDDAQSWSSRRAEVETLGSELTAQLFQDTSIPLISANIQRLVRDYATQSNVAITSTKLAESMETEGWLLVQQELSITATSQNAILELLQLIENSSPLLGISTFSVRRNRNLYVGTITVVGFSRTQSSPERRAD